MVKLYLPDFPSYPVPKTVLSETDQGIIYFDCFSPFDLDVILKNQFSHTATVSQGSLHLPQNANAIFMNFLAEYF